MRLTEEENRELLTKNIKKDVTVAFQTNLRKIEEADETPPKSPEDGKEVSRRKNVRPKSAGYLPQRGFDRGIRTRPKSTETFRKRESGLEKKRKLKQVFDVRETSSREGLRCECAALLDLDSRCSSLCDCRARSCLCDYNTDWWTSYNCFKVVQQQRRCKSNPNFSKTTFEKEKELHKMKRSLRLIGLELSDFGIYSARGMETTPRCKLKRISSTCPTKVTGRSFSLESLRHTIRKAWLEDCLDESHRKLLSRAAYEEWYFKKEKEIQEKQKEERKKRAEAKENMQKDFERKKAKAEEEFRKWMQRKRIKRKENSEKRSEHLFGRSRKTKQDAEAAFLKWKKEKDKELERKKMQKRIEEEKKMESERQKNEKKIIAEKAFQQWKVKLEQNEKLEEERRKKLKSKHEELQRRRKQEESQLSFQIWKKAKDEEIRQQMKQIREITKLQKEEIEARMEERMYEAEQAFEEWLEKIDSRKQKQFCDNFQKIPWIPI